MSLAEIFPAVLVVFAFLVLAVAFIVAATGPILAIAGWNEGEVRLWAMIAWVVTWPLTITLVVWLFTVLGAWADRAGVLR